MKKRTERARKAKANPRAGDARAPKMAINRIHREISRAHSKFCADLAFFWHGIVGGKKYPFSLYAPAARERLRDEIVRSCKAYYLNGQKQKADRLLSLWERLNAHVIRQNELAMRGGAEEENGPAPNTLDEMLALLYSGKKAGEYWKKFSRFRKMARRPSLLPPFWDEFGQFTQTRLDVSGWLMENANGKILDLGAGAFSYIQVDTAADISKKALAQNRKAKKKIAIRSLDEPTSGLKIFPSGSFDTVMLNSVLSYVKPKSRPALFSQMRRILTPGGRLLITNAPVSPVHPARIFMQEEANAKKTARLLKARKFRVQDDSVGALTRICAKKE